MSTSTAGYRAVLRVPGVRGVLLLSVLARVPHAAAAVALTLYVVLELDRGFGAAGGVTAAWTVGAAVGGPWRGRALDRLGVRRAVLPSVAVEAAGWFLLPSAGYAGVLALAVPLGLFALPTWTVVRQFLSIRVPADGQPAAYALESIGAELSFMLGPAVAVLLATSWSPRGAVVVVGVATVLAGLALLAADPPIRSVPAVGAAPAVTVEPPVPAPGAEPSGPDRPAAAGDDPVPGTPGDEPDPAGRRAILTRPVIGVLLASAVAAAVLSATDLSIVAHLRDGGVPELAAPVFVAWGAGSVAGGLLLGGRRRPLPVPLLVVALGLATAPVGLAPPNLWLALAIVPAGFFCAPTLSATALRVSRLVPERVRGEAIGWYGTAMTTGAALGAPLTGQVIDRVGAWAGFAVIGALGAGVAVLARLLID